MSIPIVDLHCDLLSYLQGNPEHTPYDLAVRCSISQLHAGPVRLQTLAVFAETGTGSVQKGIEQVKIYQNLPEDYPEDFISFYDLKEGEFFYSNKVATLLAFEGASTFCEEDEPLEQGLARLTGFIEQAGRPLYISLTWNMENRFGGGAHTTVGLKEDGKRLLNFLHQKKIALDLSHASDILAHDILNYLSKNQLDIPVMASHSNCRAVTDIPRNLPDELIREILSRRGLIGLNFYRPFVGSHAEEGFIKHLTHLWELGGQEQTAFGADFFYEEDLPIAYRHDQEMFFSDYGDSSCYNRLLDLLSLRLEADQRILKGLAYRNFFTFLQTIDQSYRLSIERTDEELEPLKV
jgi:membrane dipeptidase